MREIEFLNIKVNPLRRAEFLSIIKSALTKREKIVQFGVNSATINEIVVNEKMFKSVNSADLVSIDGMSVVWALRFLGYKIPERVATPDLADDVIAMAVKEKFSVFLFGSKEEVLSLCKKNLQKSYPLLIIAGSQNGYYDPDNEDSIVELINRADPDILLIGMSSSKKEIFTDKHRNQIKARYILGVGGYFDIVAGYTKRAPKWMQNIGLEWLFRFIQEPRRMWPRYTIGIFKFFGLVIREKFKKK